MNYSQHISINPDIRFGKPCIKGTRITVYDVLGWLAAGMNAAEIISDYPSINEEQIKACLSFAADKEHKYKIAS
ncbi:MAG: DUF433 domain-containing protein [Bacteroidetes bacterium]|nr:DUF433 domain-containing protein [Bacteroidota bacterium]